MELQSRVWSSDVFSSDLCVCEFVCVFVHVCVFGSEERREGTSVDFGGRRIVKKKRSV